MAMFGEILRKIMEAEQCFRRACGQILILNRSLFDLQRRYDMAAKEHMRAFRYTLRLRISVIEGVRNMFYAYANTKADLITELRKELILNEEQYSDSEINSEFLDDESDYDFSDSDFPYSDYDEDGEFEEDDDYFYDENYDKDYEHSGASAYQVPIGANTSVQNILETTNELDSSFLDKTNEEEGCES